MNLNLNHYEVNVLLAALNDRESVLSRDWEHAQKKSPYGAQATSLVHELTELRRISSVLQSAYSKSLAEIA
jgi:hypothetical protein